MREPRGDYARLLRRYLPDPDTITVEEYRRLAPAGPAPPHRPADPRTRTCAACGGLFAPNRLGHGQRFCSRPCRVWFHCGPGCAQRKAAS